MEPRSHRPRAPALPKLKLRSGRTKAVSAPRQANTKLQTREPKMQTSSRQPGMKLRSGRYKVEAKVEARPRQHEMKLRSDISPRGPIPQTHPITEKMCVKFPFNQSKYLTDPPLLIRPTAPHPIYPHASSSCRQSSKIKYTPTS